MTNMIARRTIGVIVIAAGAGWLASTMTHQAHTAARVVPSIVTSSIAPVPGANVIPSGERMQCQPTPTSSTVVGSGVVQPGYTCGWVPDNTPLPPNSTLVTQPTSAIPEGPLWNSATPQQWCQYIAGNPQCAP